MRKSMTSFDGWKDNGTKNDVKCWVSVDGSPAARGQSIMPLPRAAIFKLATTLEMRKEYDSQFEQGDVFEHLDLHTYLFYMRFRGVFPSAGRDFVNMVHWTVEPDGTILIVSCSVADPRKPVVDGVVRAHLHLGGWIIKPLATVPAISASKGYSEAQLLLPAHADPVVDSRGCDVTYLMRSDFKGNIPTVVTRFVASQQALVVGVVRDMLVAGYAKGGKLGGPSALKDMPPITNTGEKDEAARRSALFAQHKAAKTSAPQATTAKPAAVAPVAATPAAVKPAAVAAQKPAPLTVDTRLAAAKAARAQPSAASTAASSLFKVEGALLGAPGRTFAARDVSQDTAAAAIASVLGEAHVRNALTRGADSDSVEMRLSAITSAMVSDLLSPAGVGGWISAPKDSSPAIQQEVRQFAAHTSSSGSSAMPSLEWNGVRSRFSCDLPPIPFLALLRDPSVLAGSIDPCLAQASPLLRANTESALLQYTWQLVNNQKLSGTFVQFAWVLTPSQSGDADRPAVLLLEISQGSALPPSDAASAARTGLTASRMDADLVMTTTRSDAVAARGNSAVFPPSERRWAQAWLLRPAAASDGAVLATDVTYVAFADPSEDDAAEAQALASWLQSRLRVAPSVTTAVQTAGVAMSRPMGIGAADSPAAAARTYQKVRQRFAQDAQLPSAPLTNDAAIDLAASVIEQWSKGLEIATSTVVARLASVGGLAVPLAPVEGTQQASTSRKGASMDATDSAKTTKPVVLVLLEYLAFGAALFGAALTNSALPHLLQAQIATLPAAVVDMALPFASTAPLALVGIKLLPLVAFEKKFLLPTAVVVIAFAGALMAVLPLLDASVRGAAGKATQRAIVALALWVLAFVLAVVHKSKAPQKRAAAATPFVAPAPAAASALVGPSLTLRVPADALLATLLQLHDEYGTIVPVSLPLALVKAVALTAGRNPDFASIIEPLPSGLPVSEGGHAALQVAATGGNVVSVPLAAAVSSSLVALSLRVSADAAGSVGSSATSSSKCKVHVVSAADAGVPCVSVPAAKGAHSLTRIPDSLSGAVALVSSSLGLELLGLEQAEPGASWTMHLKLSFAASIPSTTAASFAEALEEYLSDADAMSRIDSAMIVQREKY
jgi:hypothetical protein